MYCLQNACCVCTFIISLSLSLSFVQNLKHLKVKISSEQWLYKTNKTGCVRTWELPKESNLSTRCRSHQKYFPNESRNKITENIFTVLRKVQAKNKSSSEMFPSVFDISNFRVHLSYRYFPVIQVEFLSRSLKNHKEYHFLALSLTRLAFLCKQLVSSSRLLVHMRRKLTDMFALFCKFIERDLLITD